MSSLVLLMALHAAPPPMIRPVSVMRGEGLVLVTLPTPEGMHWPTNDIPERALAIRRALEQAARPRLEGGGVSFDWLGRDPGGLPTLDFIARVKGPLPRRLKLRYHAEGPVTSIPMVAGVLIAGRETASGKLEPLARRALLERLAADEVLSGGHGQFAGVRRVLARAWRMPDPSPPPLGEAPLPGPFDVYTGAASLDDALALGRIRAAETRWAAREVPLAKIRPVTVAAHPWKAMLKGKKPRIDALADAVPHDNWYLRVSSLDTLVRMAEMTGAWGGSPLRLAEMNERDHRVMERYQRQLGLPIAKLAKAIPPKLIRGIALTGSDLFWAEGTDITVIIETTDAKALLKVLDRHAPKGRPAAEIAGGRVIVSNSPGGMRRVLDTLAGERPPLSKSLDFHYMRTVFKRDDKEEDGFVFLPDDFFAALLGPRMRIKAMRRLATRAVMLRVSHAALAHKTLTGRMPADVREMVKAGLLKEGYPVDSQGDRISWASGEASSKVFGTLRDGVPLLDTFIWEVTPAERDAYDAFRAGYERGWRTFIDPVGIRWHGTAERMRVEAHMLPLTNNGAYDGLRSVTDGSETPIDAARLAPNLAAAARMKFRWLSGDSWLGLHLDDWPGLPKWAAHQSLRLAYPEKKMPPPGVPPVTMIWGSETDAAKMRKQARWVMDRLEGTDQKMLDRAKETSRVYKGVTITRVPVVPAGYLDFMKKIGENGGGTLLDLIPLLFPREDAPAAFHTAMIGTSWYTGLDEKALTSRIDAWKKGAKEKGDPAAAGLKLSAVRPHMAATLRMLLEGQVRHKALAANVMWQALYDAGVVTPAMSEEERRLVALKLWGFVPSAPDGSAFAWDQETCQVRNVRHGTWPRPAAHATLDPKSPLAKLLGGFESLTVDLKFREDGIHSVITFGHVK